MVRSTKVALVVTVSVCALALFACKGKGEDAASAPQAIVVPLAELVADYKANEVRADTKYKGKRVQVTGLVEDIKKGPLGGIYVIVGNGKQFDIENAQCHFPTESTEKASALDKGATVTFDCKCDGKIMTAVNLGDCKFVGAPAVGTAVAAKDAPVSSGAATATIGAADICQKLVTAGVAKSCPPSVGTQLKFDLVGMPGKQGEIVTMSDEAKYEKYATGIEATPANSPLRPFFRVQKAHAVIHLRPDAPAAMVAKAKAVADGI